MRYLLLFFLLTTSLNSIAQDTIRIRKVVIPEFEMAFIGPDNQGDCLHKAILIGNGKAYFDPCFTVRTEGDMFRSFRTSDSLKLYPGHFLDQAKKLQWHTWEEISNELTHTPCLEVPPVTLVLKTDQGYQALELTNYFPDCYRGRFKDQVRGVFNQFF